VPECGAHTKHWRETSYFPKATDGIATPSLKSFAAHIQRYALISVAIGLVFRS
jgi:hypothetical protein